MHQRDASHRELAEAILAYTVERLDMDPPPLDGPRSPEELETSVGDSISSNGLGGDEALRRFVEVLAPATISVDHPLYLAFVPGAPTAAATLFDLVVSASNIYAGSWLEGAGAVAAENQALRWLVGLAGLPDTAGGVFVSGGTAGNLSALIAARYRWRARHDGRMDRVRGLVLASANAHSSIVSTARAMDMDLVIAESDERGRLDGDSLRAAVSGMVPEDLERVVAVVSTGGTTNSGVVDDLSGAATVADDLDTWFHVDGAYGAAALCVPELRPLFDGIERCDSFIVDPHKWLFAPYDCCALIYRDPAAARAAHTQHAAYLDVLHVPGATEWNPADHAHHLSRRARGLPFWFSLAVHGTDAYTEAVRRTIETTLATARAVDEAAHLELVMEPELSVVLFRRSGWDAEDYRRWSETALAEQRAFVVPTTWDGEVVLRCCFVNPLTTIELVSEMLDSMR